MMGGGEMGGYNVKMLVFSPILRPQLNTSLLLFREYLLYPIRYPLVPPLINKGPVKPAEKWAGFVYSLSFSILTKNIFHFLFISP